MTKKFYFLVLLACALAANPSFAAREDLVSVQKKLELEKKQKERLEAETAKIETELSGVKERLVKYGKSILANERALGSLEKRLNELEERKVALTDSLRRNRSDIARLILALERVRRVPPEALIVRPGAPLETAQSAMLMEQALAVIYRQAEKVRADLAELSLVTEDISQKKSSALKTTTALKKESVELSSLLKERERLYASAAKDLEERKASVRKISAQAQNLQDLVRKLEEQERLSARKRQGPAARSTPPPRPGQPQLPVTGVILARYNEPDAFGAPSKGLTIESRAGALVVAPMGGIVRFTGNFRNYGQMVILEHQGDYHSLIAGFKKIDTVVGQSVSAGEPLGTLAEVGGGKKPSLYYELRHKGSPVNPAAKFAGLG